MPLVRPLVVLLSVVALTACSPAADPGTAPPATSEAAQPWSYTTGFGEAVTLPTRPKVIVADAYSAAALWDYGIRPAGVFGYGLEPNASPLALGNADRAAMQVVGTGGELQIEKLAALKPDVVIGFGNVTTAGAGWTWWDEDVTKQATAVAPFVGVRSVGQKVPDVIEEYRRLAAALGADTTSASVVQAQNAFTAASETLAGTAKRRDLKAIALNGTAADLYVGGPGLPQLGLLNDLGATTVGPPSKTSADGEDWAEVSWELVPDYPADIVLAYVGSAKEFPEISVYRSLPAVKARQTLTWDDKMPFTYAQYASWLTEVDAVYGTAKKVAA
ncbi:ABC transporter substrate-binding protein [Microlunatus antarcticus]|uniref:Iron complex transport system substrate-binding protein n=1 Tax=Microlunatus antarcticus TaxID=53388 RepID=A0A7W5JVA8_9ACTN|nr:ABC transporter substrate-binding protein [Microlunatus antarcticus]MBB3326938.1 iron complex transport system substrate-binding protein [Microlunatus antarcticus]